jgi:hypothetical protein
MFSTANVNKPVDKDALAGRLQARRQLLVIL